MDINQASVAQLAEALVKKSEAESGVQAITFGGSGGAGVLGGLTGLKDLLAKLPELLKWFNDNKDSIAAFIAFIKALFGSVSPGP